MSSLESGGGALVDTGAAVDALGGVDDSDVVNGDGIVGANVGTGAASDTLRLFYSNHFNYLCSI